MKALRLIAASALIVVGAGAVGALVGLSDVQVVIAVPLRHAYRMGHLGDRNRDPTLLDEASAIRHPGPGRRIETMGRGAVLIVVSLLIIVRAFTDPPSDGNVIGALVLGAVGLGVGALLMGASRATAEN